MTSELKGLVIHNYNRINYLRKIKEITDKLANHPYAFYFKDPVTNEEDPIINFQQIYKKINERYYQSIEKWMADMEKMFSDGLKTFKPMSQCHAAVGELRKIHYQYLRELRYSDDELWVYKVNQEISELKDALENYEQFLPKEHQTHEEQQTNEEEQKETQIETQKEMQNLESVQ